jgi:hypothetical protein
MDLVSIENEKLRVGVLAGKGTDVVELNYKARDLDFAWYTPQAVRNPVTNFNTLPNALATFSDSYPGGWQECFPNGGSGSDAYGATYGQHGEVAVLPWDVTVDEETDETAAVTFGIRTIKSPFQIAKTMRLDSQSTTLKLTETIRNLSGQKLGTMWGQHLAWGRPFLDDSCVIRVPEGVALKAHGAGGDDSRRRVKTDRPLSWPVTEGIDGKPVDLSRVPPKGTNCEMLWFEGLNEGWYEVESIEKGIGVRVEWDVTVMPYLWYWHEYGQTTGYPWYGEMYTVGLEPFSSAPALGLGEALMTGDTCDFEPHGSRDFWLNVTLFESGSR